MAGCGHPCCTSRRSNDLPALFSPRGDDRLTKSLQSDWEHAKGSVPPLTLLHEGVGDGTATGGLQNAPAGRLA